MEMLSSFATLLLESTYGSEAQDDLRMQVLNLKD